MLTLEMAVHDALHRIKTAYDNANGNIYLGFSGGKDSTIVAELLKMAELPTNPPFVFANTGIELDATLRFVKNFPYPNIQIQTPQKPFVKILKEDGYPVVSKLKSEALCTFQKTGDASATARSRQMVSGKREFGGAVVEGTTMYKLANKHMHFLHPDHEYKIANKCCYYMKKRPFKDFAKKHDIKAYYSGIRLAEGGVRKAQYKSCTVQSGDFTHTMPIIDWTDEICDEFIEVYNVKLSDAYEVYGCERTGCISCPFSKNLKSDIEVLAKYEPLKYKASINMLKDVFVDQGIELPNDPAYTAYYEQRRPIIEQRNKEMMLKYRPDTKTAKKYQQLSLFDEE